jgi:hypothetical protein
MGIEEFKRWHWIALGALVGLALAYAWASVGSSVEGYRAVDSARFEQELTLTDPASSEPLIKGIVIHPPEDSFDGKVNVVTYKRLAKDKDGRIGWLDKRMIAKIPYREGVGSIQDLLISRSVKFNNGWWLELRWAMIIGCVGGMVLIGGVWPSLLGVMLGAGLGRQRDPEEEARKKAAKSGFDWGSLLRRAKKGEAGHAHPAVTAADQSQLQNVADAYAKNLQGSGVGHTGGGASAHADGPVRKLEAGPLEAAKSATQDEDEIEVKAKEYYPVLIHHKKHHDEHHTDARPPQDGTAKK